MNTLVTLEMTVMALVHKSGHSSAVTPKFVLQLLSGAWMLDLVRTHIRVC